MTESQHSYETFVMLAAISIFVVGILLPLAIFAWSALIEEFARSKNTGEQADEPPAET